MRKDNGTAAFKHFEPHPILEPIGIVPGGSRPAPEPVYPTYPRFLVTSLPLSVTYQPDALRQFYRGGVPQTRIIPISK